MSILDFITESAKEADTFENHPVSKLALEEQLLYLYGLSLIMNADGTIDETEKEYLRILIKSFDMDESTLDECVEFAQAPDKESAQAFFRTFRRCPIAQLFLFDALMMSSRDGNIDESEAQVLAKIAEQLEVAKGIYQDIYDLFCHIKNKDWDESSLYFSTNLLNPDHFKHILDYFGVDFDELVENHQELKKKQLEIKLRERIVADKKGIPNSLLLPLFQIMLDRKELKIVQDVILYKNDELCKIEELGFGYDQQKKTFFEQEKEFVHSKNVYLLFMKCSRLTGNELLGLFDHNLCEIVALKDDNKVAVLSREFTKEDFLIKYNDIIYSYICEFSVSGQLGFLSAINTTMKSIYNLKEIPIKDGNSLDQNEINLSDQLSSRGKLVIASDDAIIDYLMSR